MKAVFTITQKEFDSWRFRPKKEFKRITKVEDVVGQHFSGIIKISNWYDGGEAICNAYDELVKRQPELTR